MFEHGDERVLFTFAVQGTNRRMAKRGSRTSQEATVGIQGVNQYTGLSHCNGINQSSRGGEGRKVGKWEKLKRFLGVEISGI